jgi:hypothetical protein
VVAFTGGIVLIVLAVSSLFDRARDKNEIAARDIGEVSEPSFPVPALPATKARLEDHV